MGLYATSVIQVLFFMIMQGQNRENGDIIYWTIILLDELNLHL